jgi:L-methionine (R)-S-oxide reductase
LAESIHIPENAITREDRYKALLPQIGSLVSGEQDLIANLANIAASLKETFGFFWVGFYLVKGDQLVLGPFQGPVACTRIPKGKGVCGTAWMEARTILVDDVDLFPGHIACSSLSKSEIVIPGFRDQQVTMVLDVDSDKLADFDHVDEKYLSEIMKIVEAL